MDRIVWLIVLTVVANFLLECSGVWAQTKDSRSYTPPGSVGAQYQLPNRAANSVKPDDVELVDPMQTSPTENNGRSARNQLFDNIFKVCKQQGDIFQLSLSISLEHLINSCYAFLLQIPISTLQAVNDLLQGISGTFGASG